jgi:long-chain acyl-CoA synthetase
MRTQKEIEAEVNTIMTPPPAGSPYGLPLPNSATANRSPVYRHWMFRDKPLLSTFEPELPTIYHLVEDAAIRFAKLRCLGWRSWDVAKQDWTDKFEWINYAQFRERKNNLGAGIVELQDRIGRHNDAKYGVGLLSQNRPEWQITGKAIATHARSQLPVY